MAIIASMSAKTRKTRLQPLPGLEAVVGTHEADFYRTPIDVTQAVLRDPLHPRTRVAPLRAPKNWIDCGAGDGAIAIEVARRYPDSHGIAVELNPERAQRARELFGRPEYRGRVQVIQDDFLRARLPHVDLVIGNPPYTAGGGALAFARRALSLSPEVALLLRAGFVEGEQDGERDIFLEAHLHDLAVLPWRPSFRGDGETDSSTYAWFLFGPGRGGGYVRLPRSYSALTPSTSQGQTSLF